MTGAWQTSRLWEICDLYQPQTISRKEFVDGGEFPVFGANGIIGRYDRYNHEDPQLLITCRGATCGTVNKSLPQSWITGNSMVVRPRCSGLDLDYLEYFLKGAVDFSRVITGSAQPQITRKSLSPVQIRYPELTEQKRIVAILDEAFAGIGTAIANTENNIGNARELFDGYLKKIFSQREGVHRKTLDEICEIARGGSPRPIREFLTDDPDGLNWIKISDATASSKYIYKTAQKIKPEGAKRSRMVRDGDFILSNSMSFGRPYIMRTSGCIHDGWLVLRDKSELYEQEYLYYFLSSEEAYEQFNIRASGTTVRNLNIDLVRSVEVPLPPISEQKRVASEIGTLLEEIERIERIYERKIGALNELKEALLNKAFAGELTLEQQEAEVREAMA